MKEYAIRGMKIKCSKGCAYRKINVKEGHGSYIGGQPLIIKTDTDSSCVGNFGTCTGGASRSAAEHIVTAKNYNGDRVTGPACEPVILGDWTDVSENYLIDGVPAVTTDSKLICMNGGEITFEKNI